MTPTALRPPPEPEVDPATRYAMDVVAGEVVTGKLVRLACERHLRDLETAEERGLRWSLHRLRKVLQWFPTFGVHFEGPKAGQAIHLEPWQEFSIGVPFGWERWDEESQTWRRRFRRVFKEVGKKNGKSLEAGAIGDYLAFFDGQPGAKVFAAATKRDQAKMVWEPGRQMVMRSPALRQRGIVPRVLSLYQEGTASSFRPIGRDFKGEDGINPSGVIVDEIHRLEDRELLDLLSNSFGARQDPMLWMITTAGTIGQLVWVEEHDYAARVLEGLVEDDELFAYVANLDEGDDPMDESVWVKANPNLGVSVRWDDMRARAREAREKPGMRNEFERLRLNIRTQSMTRWMQPELWRSNGQAPKPLAGRIVYGGLDLGSRSDLAALVILAEDPEDDALDVHPFFWCPAEGIAQRSRRDRVPYDRWAQAGLIKATEGNVTDYDVIRNDLVALANPSDPDADRADIFEVGYDPHDATQLVTQLGAEGFRMIRILQSAVEMDSAVTEVERLLAGRKLRHGNHPVLAWMVDNVHMVEDAAGRRRPDKMKAREKIDGVPALLMALKRWMAHAGQEQTWTAA